MMKNLGHYNDESKMDAEQKQLLEYLKTFELDDFGKNGITLGDEEDEPMREGAGNGANAGLIGGVNLGYYRHPAHVKQDETTMTEILEPRPANYV